ncbi:MAG TPA: glycosyltransferase family 2 protein, partial [Candidatus Kapabacteria bacterium]
PLPKRDTPKNAEKISIVIAGKNEEAAIERCLHSLRSISYQNIEFIIVNDRSTDSTGKILDTIAAIDARIKPIHITSLPEGWLGKVNALNFGVQHATGQWLLFSDADIHFEPDVITSAIFYAKENSLDHLALLPDDRSQHEKFLVPLFVFAFGGLFIQRIKAKEIGKAGSKSYVGVGAFNLVRRSAFEKTPGFEWLKMEVIDDGGVGLMIHNTGGKSALLDSNGLLSFEWYPTLKEAIRGLEKNAFAGFANYSFMKAMIMILSMWLTVFFPIVAGLVSQNILLIVITLFFYSLLPALSTMVMRSGIKIKPLIAASLPLGYFFISLGVLNSTLKAMKNGGLRWRDTFYSLDTLRKGRRVSM